MLLSAPHPFELSTLDGATGFRLDGAAVGDRSGWSVSGAGDVNGDGFDDLLIGAYLADPGGDNAAGSTYVVFGQASGFAAAIDLATLDGTNGFRLDGVAAGDLSGFSVSAAGDVNGDGFDDLVIGAWGADPGGNTDAGSTYVLFGQASGFTAAIDLATLDGTNGFRLDGVAAVDFSGHSVSAAGDVNGDGFDDLLIGAWAADPGGNGAAGSTYVLFGQASGFAAAIDLATLDGTNGFRLDGVAASDFSGFSVSGAGDVNGDGFDDLLIGAFRADPGGNSSAGSTYVLFGQASGFAAAIDLSTLDGTTGFRLDGVAVGDVSGWSVSGAGDVNGDGFDDLLIGAFLADPGGNGAAGSTYVVFGQASGFAAAIDLSTLDGTDGFRLDGAAAFDESGRSVSAAGDVNGDGFDDLIIGAYRADPGGNSYAGSTYVVFGQASGFAAAIDLATLDGTNGFRLDGVAGGDYSGHSVSAAGDVNGDGFDDLLIGAYGAGPGGDSSAGSTYVVFGGNFTGGIETQVGGAGDQTLTASQGAAAKDVLIGGLGHDTLVSDGGADVLIGGEGNDTLTLVDADFAGTRRLVGGNGTDTLRLAGSSLHLDLTAIPDNRIQGIEVIDLTGSGDNTLTLNLLEVLNLSDESNTLRVRRDAGDTVNIGSGWTPGGKVFEQQGFFDTYTQGAATLLVQDATVVISGSAATVAGTNGDDVFLVDLGAGIVTVNNTPYQLPVGVTDVQLDGGVGNDSLTLVGTAGDEFVRLLPGEAFLDGSTAGFTGHAVSVETISYFGNGGNDLATFVDSAGNDRFVGRDAFSLMTGTGFHNVAHNVGHVSAHSSQGGSDEAFLFGTSGNEVFYGRATGSTLVGSGFRHETHSFDRVNAVAGGGVDHSHLFGTAGNDTFTARPSYGFLEGAGYRTQATGFDTVVARGGAGNDTARLVGGAGDDTFYARPTISILSGPGFHNQANSFNQVIGVASSGHDTANLGGNAGNDAFVGRPTVSSMTGSGYQQIASGFDAVSAFAGAGGVDRGILFDSAGNDLFRGFNGLGQIITTIPIYRAFDFDILTIHGTAGGINRLLVDANIQYQLNQVGSWV